MQALPILRGRQRLLFGLLLLLAGLLVGCGVKDSAESPSADSQSLRIGTTMAIKQANPLADYYYNILAMLMTHDSLVRFDENLKPVPQLAQSFSSDKQARVWTFELAPNVRWHDGRPLTPADVAFTFDYIVKHHTCRDGFSDLIAKTEIDGNRIVFRLKRPYGRFLFDAGFVRILPRHVWQAIDDPYRTRRPDVTVGCGPYRFAGFDSNSGVLRFEANRVYYGRPVGPQEVTFRTYGSMDLLVKDLSRHRLDLFYQYASGVPAPYVAKLKRQSGLTSLNAVSMGLPAVLGFNLARPITADLAVRRAIALAIDYDQLNACLMNGQGSVPSPGLVPPSLPHQLNLPPWRQDLAQANQLLASRGHGKASGVTARSAGQPLKLTILTRSDLWGESQITKLLARDLEKLGISLQVRSADLSTYQAFLKQGDYDLILFRTTPLGMQMYAGHASGYFDTHSTGSNNPCRLADKRFERLCETILATTDTAELADLYRQMQQYYADNLPAIALCWGKSVFPYATSWQGYSINQLEGGLANRFSWVSLAPAMVKP